MPKSIKMNPPTTWFSQAEVEEQLSLFLVNARDRKGGRKERALKKRHQTPHEEADL